MKKIKIASTLSIAMATLVSLPVVDVFSSEKQEQLIYSVKKTQRPHATTGSDDVTAKEDVSVADRVMIDMIATPYVTDSSLLPEANVFNPPEDGMPLDELLYRVKAGNRDAMWELAFRCFDGIECPQGLKGMDWVLKAAKLGHPKAMNEAGFYYLDRIAEHPSHEQQALHYLSESDRMGDPLAAYNLAKIYGNESLNNHNEVLAVEMLTRASAGGFHTATYKLAIHYRDGVGVVANQATYNELMSELRAKNITAGDIVELSISLDKYLGAIMFVQRIRKEEVSLSELGAYLVEEAHRLQSATQFEEKTLSVVPKENASFDRAEVMTYEITKTNWVPGKKDEAIFTLLRSAAEFGDATAQALLAERYATGIGTTKSMRAATYWKTRSAQPRP